MAKAKVKWTRDKEARVKLGGGWTLCLQWVKYVYEDERPSQEGYRFIWRKPGGQKLQAARGQARIPSLAIARRLMAKAEKEGWGRFEGPFELESGKEE
jgi:hypothetical protein